ncbi:MAG TPA: family 10 glycosylhydrolase [Anaerolineae bacterium]|nr:family 10 glycosylhydrolase [Anaerolineae bacterium]
MANGELRIATGASADQRISGSASYTTSFRFPISDFQTLKWVLPALGLVAMLFLGMTTFLRAESPPDFEALAGQMGRAEAWYALNGYPESRIWSPESRIENQPALPIPQSLIPHLPSDTPWPITHTVFMPLAARNFARPPVERRILWVTRYDWTSLTAGAAPDAIDAIVANAAGAGFNTLFFQVRAAGDAYYTPGLEPWASRLTAGPVSETLGVDPGWDPLARLLDGAHAAGLDVHAYVNVYPAWQSPPTQTYGLLWPPAVTPAQMFDRFTYGPGNTQHPGEFGLGYTWRQYDDTPAPMPLVWGQYLWASPGVDAVQEHVAAVVRDIVTRYPVDGVHLDLVRYAGRDYSHDPFSAAVTGTMTGPARAQWQRDRVTALVRRVASETHALRPDALVSAAVWPYYKDDLGLHTSSGYDDYYQDSKGWLAGGALDAIAPMLYGSGASIPDDLGNWQVLAADFLEASAGRDVYPGIAGYYDDFDAIAQRIAAARALGAPGHAIFSYSALDSRGYWDDLASGPYSAPALLP